jgi:hypothetical protein
MTIIGWISWCCDLKKPKFCTPSIEHHHGVPFATECEGCGERRRLPVVPSPLDVVIGTGCHRCCLARKRSIFRNVLSMITVGVDNSSSTLVPPRSQSRSRPRSPKQRGDTLGVTVIICKKDTVGTSPRYQEKQGLHASNHNGVLPWDAWNVLAGMYHVNALDKHVGTKEQQI